MDKIKTSSFVKKLASNDRKIREKAFENLKKFIATKKNLIQLDYEKIWKGLFYTMWFSDRPRPQQRIAQHLASLMSDPAVVADNKFDSFVKAFWKVVCIEWPGLDKWRIDKFYMLMRYVIKESFRRLAASDWDEELVSSYIKALQSGVLSPEYEINKNIPLGVVYHITDVYIDEYEKIVFGENEETEDDEEEEDESSGDDEETLEAKKEKVAQTPLNELLEPFRVLQKASLVKTFRLKLRDDLFLDSRLEQWGIDVSVYKKHQQLSQGKKNDGLLKKDQSATAEKDEEDESTDEGDDNDEEEEWTGFGN